MEKSLYIILMDIQMPEMNGFETIIAIRNKEKESNTHIPIIAMTPYAMQSDAEHCLESGMDAYLNKPINANKLLKLITILTTNTAKG